MRIGVPTEIKNHEYRVGLTPNGARELVAHGHEVFVQDGAGNGAGFSNEEYVEAGAEILADAPAVFEAGELIVKVKEPQPSETAMLTARHTLFTYLHLAPDPVQTEGLRKSGCIAIAYETVTDINGRLPLLRPMSEVAGRMSVHVGANALHKAAGGRGVLMGGVPGVTPAKVVILGAGVSGSHAAEMALGLRADVTVLDRSLPKLAETDQFFRGQVKTRYSTQGAIAVSTMDGLWDDVRMACSQSDSDATESYYAQVDAFASTNGSWDLLGAASNGTSYTVDANLNSSGLSTIWHDNETSTQNSGHYLCDYTNSSYTSSFGGAPQFSFCYTFAHIGQLNDMNTHYFASNVALSALPTRFGPGK